MESTPEGVGSQHRGGGTGWMAQATDGSCLGPERRKGRLVAEAHMLTNLLGLTRPPGFTGNYLGS